MSETNTFFDDLVQDLKFEILKFLRVPELCPLRLTSRANKTLCDHDAVWKAKCTEMLFTDSISTMEKQYELFIPEEQFFTSDPETKPSFQKKLVSLFHASKSEKKKAHNDQTRDLPAKSWKQFFKERFSFSFTDFPSNNEHIKISKDLKSVSYIHEAEAWKTTLTSARATPKTPYCEFRIDEYNPGIGNSIKIFVGVAQDTLEIKRNWIGTQYSYGFGATGSSITPNGSSYDTSQTNEHYGKGDIVGVLCDFDCNTLHMVKNRNALVSTLKIPKECRSLKALHDEGKLYFGVSLTGKGFTVSLLPQSWPPAHILSKMTCHIWH